MKNILRIIIVTGLVFPLGLGLVFEFFEKEPVVQNQESDIPIGITKGEMAPDFIGTTLNGETIKLSDLRGKTVVINVFASWCGPCQLEAPHLAQVYKDLGGDAIEFIGLNLEENPSEVAAFQAEHEWVFPVVLNQDGVLTDIYHPIGLPTSWFIDPQGVIQYVHTGPVTAKMLEQAIFDVQEGYGDPLAIVY
jgi:thiol-disulfide isomerase/thioredoxin